MTKLHIIPIEEPKADQSSTQWSIGLTMFAAFVMPFVLLMVSARYQTFVARASARMSEVDSWGLGNFRFSKPGTVVMPTSADAPAPGNVPTTQPASNHE
jgi:hypothetical protein